MVQNKNEQASLAEMKWKNRLCPFEKVHKWKHGFSIKCPVSTSVCWCQDKDDAIIRRLNTKRALTCRRCKEQMQRFLEAM